MSAWVRVAGALMIAVGVALSGCGQERAQVPRRTVGMALPGWAPDNPSEEFLRAAAVLKPLPPEVLHSAAQADPAWEATFARYTQSFTAAYELFGTLSDEQVQRFLSSKVIRIATKSATPPQRAALDNWFDAFREAMEGGHPELADYLVILYKEGAAEDLSNVDFGFNAGEGMGGGHMVHVCFWVRKPDGSVGVHGTAFAQI